MQPQPQPQSIQKKTIQLSLLAYKKITFHCLRYSSCKVYGALISTKSTSQKQIITNAYPLFHSPIVNPTFCIALDLIQSNLSQNQQIYGFYQFIQNGSSCFNKILETNQNLNKNMKLLKVWMANDQNQLKFAVSGCEIKHGKLQDIKKDLLQGQHNFIVDFDAHFEEIQLDFNNNYVKVN